MTQALLVKFELKDPAIAAEMKEMVSALPGFRISSNGTDKSDILLLEIGGELDQEFRQIEQMRARGIARDILLTSPRKDSDLLLGALKAGVKEFFPQPLNKEDIKTALLRIRKHSKAGDRETETGKQGRLIAVIGSKGGVGTTTLSVNLAVALQQAGGGKIALTDMTPFPGSVDLFLDVHTLFSWADAAADIERIDATYLLNTLFKHRSGIYILPAPLRLVQTGAVAPETMERVVALMRTAFDFVVIDVSNPFDDVSFRMLELSDTGLLVTELNVPAVINARRLLDALEGLGLPEKDIRLVVNRYQKKSPISPAEAERTIGRRIITEVPNDYDAIMSAINSGTSLFDTGPGSPAGEALSDLAGKLLSKEGARKERAGFFAGMINRTGKAFSRATWNSPVIERFKQRTGLLPHREAVRYEAAAAQKMRKQ